MPCYEQFVMVQKRALVPLMFFLHSRLGQHTGIYYIDSTALPVCDNHRIHRHKPLPAWPPAAKPHGATCSNGATFSRRKLLMMGWFFGFKLLLVFNHLNEIGACKLTPGPVHDTRPVAQLTKQLLGKLFADKGYIGKKLAEELLRRGLTLFTRVRKNIKALPLAMSDKLLLNARNMAETIIGSLKEFSSLNLPKPE